MSRNVGLRILAAIILLAAVAGIAAFAYNAGTYNAASVNVQAPPASGQPLPYYGYGMPYWHQIPFFGFGCFSLLVPLFLLFLVFGAVRHLIWGPRMGLHHMSHWHHAAWDDKTDGENFVPPMFAEIHRRAHAGMEKPEDSSAQK